MWCNSSIRGKGKNQCGHRETAEWSVLSVLQPTARAGLVLDSPYRLPMAIFVISWNLDPGQQDLPLGHNSLVLYFELSVIKDNGGVKVKLCCKNNSLFLKSLYTRILAKECFHIFSSPSVENHRTE